MTRDPLAFTPRTSHCADLLTAWRRLRSARMGISESLVHGVPDEEGAEMAYNQLHSSFIGEYGVESLREELEGMHAEGYEISVICPPAEEVK